MMTFKLKMLLVFSSTIVFIIYIIMYICMYIYVFVTYNYIDYNLFKAVIKLVVLPICELI